MSDEMSEKSPKTCRENRQLKNYSSWLEEWNRVQDRIAKSVKCKPEELVMNHAEGLQQVNTEKLVLNYAEIPTEFDKYRGKPDFWKLPLALTPRKCCGCGVKCTCRCARQPDYFAIKTKREQFVVPSVENVGVPQKNILTRSRNIYKSWQSSAYRQKRMQDLAEKITKIVPHWPSYKNLVVIGSNPPTSEETAEPLEIVETSEAPASPDTGEDISCKSEQTKPRLALIFNETRLDLNTCQDGKTTVRVFFMHDISNILTSVYYLHLENVGLATLRINWIKQKKFRLFHTCASDQQEVGFYFDKRELLILPGRSVEFPIWFRCNTAGNFSESYEVQTLPKVWGDNSRLVLLLQSYAYFGHLKKTTDLLLNYIDVQARNALLRDILNELTRDLKYANEPARPCEYGKKQLFEIANLRRGRPLFLFNDSLVDELKRLYERIRINDGEDWNYCVQILQRLAHAKDVAMYLDLKSVEVEEKIKRIERELLEENLAKDESTSNHKQGKNKNGKNKPTKSTKDEGKKKLKKEGETSESSHQTEENKPETSEPFVYSNQADLWSTLRKFDAPVIINSEREKFMMCYSVVSGCFGKMSQMLACLKEDRSIMKHELYPPLKYKLVLMHEQPERLVYEYFEPDYISSNLGAEICSFEAKRRPKKLQEISCDDIETLYATYFNKPLASEKEKTKSKPPKDKKTNKTSKNGKKKSKAKKGADQSGDKLQLSNDESLESFNPFSEKFTFVSKTEETEATNEDLTMHAPKNLNHEDYKYNQYLIVYSCLGQAVEACIDALHSFQCSVPYSVLEEVKPLFPDASQQ